IDPVLPPALPVIRHKIPRHFLSRFRKVSNRDRRLATSILAKYRGIMEIREGEGPTDTLIMNELIFLVEEAAEGGFTARALGESIFTEAESLDELRTQVRDSVRCHFDEGKAP